MGQAPVQINRRQVLRLLGGSALALGGVALVSPGTVEARRVWCRLDPTFRVNGLVGNVYVSGLIDTTYDTTGPIELTFTAPTEAVVELLDADDGFGLGYAVTIAYDPKLKNDDGKIGLRLDVRVPATTSDLPILVEFLPLGAVKVSDLKSGTTNTTITVKTELGTK